MGKKTAGLFVFIACLFVSSAAFLHGNESGPCYAAPNRGMAAENFSAAEDLSLSADGINAYPNPCRTARSPIVTIGNIPASLVSVQILIFNVAGELVKTLSEGNGVVTLANGKAGKWDATNSSNQKVASGVYIYLVKANGSKQKTGKIAVLR